MEKKTKKVVVISSHTPSLFWFRLDMMKAMIEEGYSVIAVGQESEKKWSTRFLEHGIVYQSSYVKRNSINPLYDLKCLISIFKLLKTQLPDKIFVYQAKTIVYTAIAAKFLGITELYILIAGTGSVFRANTHFGMFVKNILTFQYRLACLIAKNVFFQNNDDLDLFIKNRILKSNKAIIINGSGVNLNIFTPFPLPSVTTFIYIGRLIKDKGIIEYLKACEILKSKYINSRCLLIGPFDSNPTSINNEELNYYVNKNIIEYYGEQEDVRPYLNISSVLVLPSYQEGTPKSVLEAMATARAIITSNAPGCKETVLDNISGFLVPIMNIEILSQKMIFLYENPDILAKMATKSLDICKEKYDVIKVNKKILQTMGITQSIL